MYFKGNIIIIDPCYIVKDDNDWEKSCYGKEMSALGFSDFLYISGDEYNCSVINIDTNEEIGKFCTDSAAVVILDFDELMNYRPEFDDHIKWPNSNTVIYGFDGDISVDTENFIIYGKGNINFRTVEK